MKQPTVFITISKVIQHERQMSLKEVCLEDLRLHNEDLKEFVELQTSLPDFGIWQDAVVNWGTLYERRFKWLEEYFHKT
ncbi:hypothetical protein DRF60_13035 [Chryseobacterium elymi]|uniref:Uncharacterized protein n=1 Tax=Chryseobacterium elymi TaxID=395936 RepID=A0A3D9DFQ1_9FLAO|nr:hypothetical protein [Chryseobacterium elymi]REC76809.1 hypothetical protein DRF60_13035 [Chryseobacterium elymi]